MRVPLLAWVFHKTLIAAAQPALGLFGLCGIWGFGSFFLYDRRQRAKVRLDEREEKINEQATIIGFAMAWMVFVALCMGVWAFCFFVVHRTTVPIGFLVFLTVACVIVQTVFQSLVILVEYRRSCGHGTL